MIVARKPSISSEVLRFATVGLTATLVYFVAFNVVSYGTAFSPVIANIVAFGLSLAVSYLGHKHVTFRASGSHSVYLPKFFAITAVLVSATSVLSVAGTSWLQLPPYMVAFLVSASYPVGSFFLNKFWVFKE
jgi:putative flippase GtrA